MHDYSRLNNSIKITALKAFEASKPIKIVFGIVTSEDPLIIEIESKLPLNKNQLILSRNVTGYKKHMNPGLKHNLKVNDELILFRLEGGQQFLVSDWIGW